MAAKWAKVLIPGILAGSLAGAGYLWWSHGPIGRSAHNLDQLTREAPARSFFWAGAELQDQLQADQLKQQLKAWRQASPKVEELAAKWESSSGQPIDQLLDTYAASAQLALLPKGDRSDFLPNGSDPPLEAILVCQLKDRAPLESWLKSARKPGAKDVAFAGCNLLELQRGGWASLSSDALYLASSQSALQAALEAGEQHKNTLDQEPLFQQAWKQIPELGKSPGAAFYYRLDSTWNTLDKLRGPYVDSDTLKSLRGLPYLVGGVYPTRQGWQSEFFVALDAQSDSSLARQWLKAPQRPLQLSQAHPQNWAYFQSLDLFYTFEALLEVARLAPQGRTGSTMALSWVGMHPQGERRQKIQRAFTGEVAWGIDLASLLKALPQEFQQARGQGQTTACKSNLKNCATALEMYACDSSGRYPTEMQALTPNYLRTLPTCPTAGTYTYTYQRSEQPDNFTLLCQGNHHGMGPDLPRYTAVEGLNAPSPSEEVAQARASQSDKALRGVLWLGVQDPSTAQELLEQLARKARTRAEKFDLEGQPAWRSQSRGQAVCWTLLKKPSALVVSAGPSAEESLKTVMQVAGGQQPSMASNSQAKTFTQAHQTGIVAQHFLDTPALVAALEGQAEGRPLLDALKAHTAGPDLGALQVESGGLRYTNRGLAGLLGSSLGLGAPLLIPNFIKARGQGQLTACKSNQKNLATALEMWSTDHSGHYPERLSEVVPDYLRSLPTCPSAGKDTYSQSYSVGTSPDRFQFFCQGHHHPSTDANYPQYTSEQGLIERP